MSRGGARRIRGKARKYPARLISRCFFPPNSSASEAMTYAPAETPPTKKYIAT